MQRNSQPQRSAYFPRHLRSLHQKGIQWTSAHRPGQCQGQPARLDFPFYFVCSCPWAQLEGTMSFSSSVPIPCQQPEQNHSAISLKTAQPAERPSSETAPRNISRHATSHAVLRICNLICCPHNLHISSDLAILSDRYACTDHRGARDASSEHRLF